MTLDLMQHLPSDAILLHQASDAVVDGAQVLVDQLLQLVSLSDRIVLLRIVQVLHLEVFDDLLHLAYKVV